MNRNINKTLAVTTAAIFLAMAIVPAAEAQAGTVQGQLELKQGDVSPANIAPDITVAKIEIDWDYRISDAGYGLQSDVATTTTMTWDDPTCDQQGIVISGPLTNLVTVSRQQSSTSAGASGTKDFTLQATQQAPGETPTKCTFQARVNDLGTQVKATEKQSTTATFVVDYLGLVSANLPSTIKQAGPQKEIKYDIELTNLGNARSNIRFDLITESIGDWDPVPPTEIILDSPNQGGQETTKTVSFQVSTPFKNGWNNDQKTLQLRITPVSTKNADIEGTSVTINTLSRVRGVYVPSLEPMVMLGAVLGAAFVAARLRQE